MEAAEAGARDAAALLESSAQANRDADPLVADLTRMHGENHFALRIAEAFRLQAGGRQ